MSEPALMEPPTATSPAVPTDPLADLILARLLPAKKSVGSKQLHNDLALFRRGLATGSLNETLAALRTAGLVTLKGQLLTTEGQARAMAYLGITELPPKANWGTIKAKYLIPKALGLSPTSNTKQFSKAEQLAPLLLKRQLGLPVGTGNSLGAVFEAIACRVLGYQDHAKFKELIPHLLGKAIDSKEPIDMDKADKVVPRVLLNAPTSGMAGLRAVALAGLMGTESRPPIVEPEPEPFDLEAFANTVIAVARKSPTGWFGDNKVFINHVWRQAQDEPQLPSLGLTGFKEKLVEASRENLLTLSRVDLVQVMNQNDVQESETTYLNAVFHFILVEKS